MCYTTDGEIATKFNTGAIFSKKDFRDYEAVCTAAIEFPKDFELKMVRIKNQGVIGSCVAHAISEVIEYFNSTQLNDQTEMSTGYVYGNRTTSTHKGVGMVTRDALKVAKLYGDVPKTDFPYNVEVPRAIEEYKKVSEELYEVGYPNRISAYAKLTTENAVKQALMNNGPVIMAMEWFNDMQVKNGILTTNKKQQNGGHCMVIYGWNEKGWKVQNSWGKLWGDNGCCIIPYEMPIREFWAVADDIIQDMQIKKPFSSTFGKILAKILNWFVNLF